MSGPVGDRPVDRSFWLRPDPVPNEPRKRRTLGRQVFPFPLDLVAAIRGPKAAANIYALPFAYEPGGPPTSAKAVVRKLVDPFLSAEDRRALIVGVSPTTKGAAHILRRGLQDPFPHVRRAAVEGLVAVALADLQSACAREPAAVDVSVGRSRTTPPRSSDSPALDALEALWSAQGDPHPETKADLQAAIQRIASQAEAPFLQALVERSQRSNPAYVDFVVAFLGVWGRNHPTPDLDSGSETAIRGLVGFATPNGAQELIEGFGAKAKPIVVAALVESRAPTQAILLARVALALCDTPEDLTNLLLLVAAGQPWTWNDSLALAFGSVLATRRAPSTPEAVTLFPVENETYGQRMNQRWTHVPVPWLTPPPIYPPADAVQTVADIVWTALRFDTIPTNQPGFRSLVHALACPEGIERLSERMNSEGAPALGALEYLTSAEPDLAPTLLGCPEAMRALMWLRCMFAGLGPKDEHPDLASLHPAAEALHELLLTQRWDVIAPVLRTAAKAYPEFHRVLSTALAGEFRDGSSGLADAIAEKFPQHLEAAVFPLLDYARSTFSTRSYAAPKSIMPTHLSATDRPERFDEALIQAPLAASQTNEETLRALAQSAWLFQKTTVAFLAGRFTYSKDVADPSHKEMDLLAQSYMLRSPTLSGRIDDLLNASDPDIRKPACEWAYRFRPDQSVARLRTTAMIDNPPSLRQIAVEALLAINSPESFQAALSVFFELDIPTPSQNRALVALMEANNPVTLPALTRVIEEENPGSRKVRMAAAMLAMHLVAQVAQTSPSELVDALPPKVRTTMIEWDSFRSLIKSSSAQALIRCLAAEPSLGPTIAVAYGILTEESQAVVDELRKTKGDSEIPSKQGGPAVPYSDPLESVVAMKSELERFLSAETNQPPAKCPALPLISLVVGLMNHGPQRPEYRDAVKFMFSDEFVDWIALFLRDSATNQTAAKVLLEIGTDRAIHAIAEILTRDQPQSQVTVFACLNHPTVPQSLVVRTLLATLCHKNVSKNFASVVVANLSVIILSNRQESQFVLTELQAIGRALEPERNWLRKLVWRTCDTNVRLA
jgi:hypothetical protein